MPEVGAYDAKTHLPKLLERTQKGERFVITKHGRPVAELVPVFRTDPDVVRRTIGGIHSFREILRKRGVRVERLLKKDQGLLVLAH